MHDWRDFIIRHFTSLEGAGAAVALGLLVFASVVLVGKERKGLRVPTLLLLCYVVLEVVHRGLFGPIQSHGTIALISLLMLLVALTRVAFLLIVDWFLGRHLGQPVPRIFRDILQGFLFVATTLVLFRSMGVELGSLLTTSAILTAAIGLSLQESLGNLFAGLAVRAEHPFEIGDWIDIGEGHRNVGQVVEINWRATKIRTNDLVELVVPNSFIAKSTLQNYSRPSTTTRRTVSFVGPYDVTPNRVKNAVLPALRGCPGVASEPPPKLWVNSFADSGIEYQVIFFLNDCASRADIDSDVRTRIWYAIHRAGLHMPYPIRDVRIHKASKELELKLVRDNLSFEATREVLDDIQLFKAMPEAIRKQLAEVMVPELYADGETIILEGDHGDDLYVVVDGSVTVITHSTNGERLTLAGLGRGQIFGELSLLTGVRSATVLAARQSQLLRLGHDDFRRIVSQVPGLGESILTQVVERQDQLGRAETLGLDPETPSSAFRGVLFDKIRRFFGN